jgi:hypothetical protein
LFAVLTKTHDSANELRAIRMYRAYLMEHGHVLKTVITDAGVVERDQELLIQLGELGIRMSPVPPEAQFANPVERSIQTVVKGMGAMFVNQEHLPNTVWSLALLEFIDASNACPNAVSGEYSRWYHLTGRHPVISERFRFRFGQPVVSVILHQNKSKFTFAPHGEFGFAVGAAMNGAILMYIPSRSVSRVYWRRDVRPVRFAEAEGGGPNPDASLPTINDDGSITIPEFPRQSERIFDLCTGNNKVVHVDHGDTCQLLREVTATGDLVYPTSGSKVSPTPGSGELDTDAESADDGEEDGEPIAKRVRRVSTPVVTVAWYDDPENQWYCPDLPKIPASPPNHDGLREAYVNATISLGCDPDNPSLKQAMEGPEWVSLWEPACGREMRTLEEFGTGTVVQYSDIPQSAVIYPTKFV